MVDAIGSKPVTGEQGATQVVRTDPVRPVQTATNTDTTATETPAAAASTLASATQDMAASAPVDSDRVAQIRRAVQNGTFPIFPGKIADRLIALSMQWNPNDAS